MDVKISELPESEGLRAGCCFPVVTDDTTYKVTFQQITNHILEAIYPVGSIYMSTNQVNPSVIFGGSWERIKDKFLLSAGDTYNAGSTGGEASHTLNVDEIPRHRHYGIYGTNGDVKRMAGWGESSIHTGTLYEQGYEAWEDLQTGYTGGGQAHNNMPPYLVVYMWKRIF